MLLVRQRRCRAWTRVISQLGRIRPLVHGQSIGWLPSASHPARKANWTELDLNVVL
jgi:hypothetical protein